MLYLPLLNKVDCEIDVTCKLLHSVQTVILDDEADLEIAVDGQLMRLFNKIALPLINLAFFNEDRLLGVCLQSSIGRLFVLHLGKSINIYNCI